MGDERATWTFEGLASQDRSSLEDVLRSGEPVTAAEVVGFEFRGWNLNSATKLIGTRKFKKGFYRDRTAGTPWGYNVRVRQGRIDEPWVALPSDATPRRFYFFGVSDPAPGNRHPNALVVDYRRWPGNSVLDPVRYTVDYLVAPDPAKRDLLLGKSYAEFPIGRPFLGFFILERHNPSDFDGPAANGGGS